MSSILRGAQRPLVLSLLLGFSFLVRGQNSFQPQAGEYGLTGTLPGDQVWPDVSINSSGGYAVWQDGFTDGDGLGLSAQRLNANLSGAFSPFRVNEQGAGDQENAKVALLKNGGAVFVWQGGVYGFQHIFARFLKSDGTFATGDIMVNTYTNGQQINPSVAASADGGAWVVWSSDGQDGDMQGVYGQRLSATGEKLGAEFQVNQTTLLNQRSPAITALANGNFAVVWISEKLHATVYNIDPTLNTPVPSGGAEAYDVDALARLYDAGGNALAGEFKVNSRANTCANPAISGAGDGGFAVVWGEYIGSITTDGVVSTNGWDIAARCFDTAGNPKGAEFPVNTYTYGDQFSPKISTIGTTHLVVWTSLAQDGSREGVFGQFVSADGQLLGSGFGVNTTTLSQQYQQAVASDGLRRFLVVWTSYVGGAGSFDLFAQRYSASQTLMKPASPYVSALSQSRLSVTWPPLAGYNVDHYELYVDQGATPTSVTNNAWVMTGLVPSSTHAFQLAYQLTDGEHSPLSDPAAGTTWGEDLTGPNGVPDGLPDDWEAKYFGPDPSLWPSLTADTDGDGATTLQEYLVGTDPTDPGSVLRMQITSTSQGLRLNWNTQPGFIYQVQSSANLASWSSFGNSRFAAGTTDSVAIAGGSNNTYYRVIRLR
ncbi:MAG: fibronectin type III domain-containing protein [Limisphaerales bacterium]